MKTLVIHAPKSAVNRGSRSFQDTFSKQVGDEYGIFPSLFAQIKPGCPVILLSNPEKQQAEGRLVKLTPRTITRGVQRYDVEITKPKMVTYRGDQPPLKRCLNRWGVAVI